MSSSVLLAAISIMPYDYKHETHYFELENEKERSSRMARVREWPVFWDLVWTLKRTPEKW